ncbi:MAG: hypothetical protein JKY92_05140 [Magnetovibrio sp.]|nr:hypothetical protein [Magnetovibrio sp.]
MASKATTSNRATRGAPSRAQSDWLQRGVNQPGGKLPLFNEEGQQVPERTVKSCIDKGWAEPWFSNPLKPDWIVCKLTDQGRKALQP